MLNTLVRLISGKLSIGCEYERLTKTLRPSVLDSEPISIRLYLLDSRIDLLLSNDL